ncbi:MAG: DNA repair protein RecO [Chloroflexota bacterium]
MTKPRNYKTEAIIIKKTKLGEADRILTFYTPHLGKIQAVAKGVRRPRSKMSGHLELLTHSLVPLARGKNLDTVTGCQTINSFLAVKSDLELSSYALYVIELINKFTEENIENYPLFKLLLETLKQLEKGSNNELVLRYFEIHLLSYVGYRPQLQHCVLCHSPLKQATLSFSPKAGGMLCPDCNNSQPLTYKISLDGLKLLRVLQESDYEMVNQLEAKPQSNYEIEWMIRNYIRYLLERDVKSIAWLDTIRRQNREGKITLL